MMMKPLKAIYGCRNNSHDLLFWEGDSPLPPELLGLTDKPGGYVTPKEKWWPAINCGPVGNWWALWSIEPDLGAPRSGMVKSTVLLWELDKVPQVHCLEEFIYQLVNHDECKPPYSSLLQSVANELICTDNILAIEADETLPLLIAHLWENLWGEARKEFSVRSAFTPPQALVRAKLPTFYYVPASVLNQWYLPNVSLINSTTTTETSRAANYLISRTKNDSILHQLLLNCSELTGDLKVLNKLGRAADNIDQFSANSTLTNAIVALRTLIACSPSPDKATDIKNELLSSIKMLMVSKGDASDILTMCNLSSDAVPKGAMPEVELSTWIEHNLITLSHEDLNKYFERALPDKSTQWWSQSVVNGISTIVNKPETSEHILFWLSIVHFQKTFLRLSSVRQDLEQMLFESAKTSDMTAVSLMALEQFSISQEWAKLHAWAVFNLYDEEQVYNKHCNSMPNWTEGVPFIVQSLSHRHAINLLRDSAFSPFINLLAERSLKEPILLNYIDVAEPNAFLMWQKQLDIGGRFYPPNIETEAFLAKLCDCLQTNILPRVFEQISQEISEYLLSNESRSKVWSQLDPTRSNILAKDMTKKVVTTPQALQHLSDTEPYFINELKAHMTGNHIEPAFLLSYLSQSITHREDDVLNWVKKAHSKNFHSHAHMLGNVILEKRWSKVANYLYQSSYGWLPDTPYFKPAVEACSGLLNASNKFWFSFHTGTSTQPHQNEIIKKFSEVSADLAYDRLDYIWQKAGGKPSRLKNSGTELDKWFYAASEAEKGALNRGLIDLLDVLIEEYPHNKRLREIHYIVSNRY
ncbi:effector-associated domain EAD1-containing protein [Vibrio hepatarius]|uniref:GAP1-N1 domain-containing protein n=1 Tax=Vibrio hepatarius TaxID=171383 RepID=UPI003736A9A1